MFRIDEICEKISNNIAQELNLDDDRKAVINYGIFAFIQMGICIALVIIFGFIFNVTIEALIVSFIISSLRKSSGGAHAPSPGSCAIIGTIVSVGMGLISKYMNINISFVILVGGIVFIWSYYILYKLAPVDSVSKPIRSIEKRTKLKKSSINILSFYLIIVMITIVSYLFVENRLLLTYSLCIYMGILWQVFSLTQSGHAVYRSLNKLF
ncbi:accessory gene regulator B family protein [Clostridium sp.]|uniref:accessory gene regulator ArgB-like protein n=1 Tax=Clostridium sp. TaxID=1506 RepID=UPI00284277FA|nr:accessory gene regulator B family protein [Clostridium sp.]MDR3598434.1 accessory gene regulator B family protein [Clostridium sp.]